MIWILEKKTRRSLGYQICVADLALFCVREAKPFASDRIG